MEYFVYHIAEAQKQFGEDKTQSHPKQMSIWAKQILLQIIKEKGLEFNTAIECTIEGKPFFPFNKDIHFSISHTNQYIAIALSNTPIGIDIEEERKYKKALVERFLHPKEALYLETLQSQEEQDGAFTKIWTIKEAYVKCTGTGIANNFQNFYISLSQDQPQIHTNQTPVEIKSIYHKDKKLYISICLQ